MVFTVFQVIYNVGIYLFFIITLPYFFVKIITTKKYRVGLIHRLGFLSKEAKNILRKGNIIWVHAVSVGEAQTSFPLIDKLCVRYPEKNIILSTTTVTGQAVAKKWAVRKNRVTVIYFPLDFFHIFHRLFTSYKIDMIIILETEIWPNFLMEAYRHNIPVILANGRISQKSYDGYKKIQYLFAQCTRAIKFFCMQDKADAEKLDRLGIDNNRIIISGNIKYEASAAISIDERISEAMRFKLNWDENEPVLVAGSTHKGEEEILCQIFNEIRKKIPDLKMVLAPRHPERLLDVENILANNNITYLRKTSLDYCNTIDKSPQVILVDTMGELRHIYLLAQVCFIGKSLVPGGGQNILEPASLAKPIVFGKYMDNFAVASKNLLEAKGAVMVNNAEELKNILIDLFLSPEKRNILGNNALKEIKKYCGAIEKILSCVKSIMPE